MIPYRPINNKIPSFLGFHLIEMLVVIVLLGVITGFGWYSFNALQAKQELRQTTAEFGKILMNFRFSSIEKQETLLLCPGKTSCNLNWSGGVYLLKNSQGNIVKHFSMETSGIEIKSKMSLSKNENIIFFSKWSNE